MTYKEILAAIKTAFETGLPPRLIEAGADPIDKFLATTPDDEDERQVCVYLDKGENDRYDVEDGYIVQVQLPDKRDPSDYLDAVLTSIAEDINPREIGYLSLDGFEWDVLYSGKPPRGGQGSFIYINVSFKQSLDDCPEG